MTHKPSIERPWLNAYPKGADKIELPKMTAYSYMHDCNKDNLQNIAIEYFDRQISYADMFGNISQAAKSFTAFGVKKGDIVTVCLPNQPEAVYSFYALNKIGACANMISPSFAPDHIAGCINITESKLLIIMDKFYALMKPLIVQTCVNQIIIVSGGEALGQQSEILTGDGLMLWHEFISNGVNKPNITVGYADKIPAVICYSSGSTGASKGIVLPNEAFIAMATMYDIVVERMQIKSNDAMAESCLVIIPFFTATSINTSLHIFLCHSKIIILEPEYNTKIFVQRVLDFRPNYTLTSTSFLQSLMSDNSTFERDLSFLKYPNVGGEPLDSTLEAMLNEFFKSHNSMGKVVQGWGMNEFGATVTTTGIYKNDKGTGKPLSHIIVSAFDPDTDEELGYNERGEIRVITPCRMLGYYKNPEATAAFFREGLDGQMWGCSGDVGYIDEDGNVFVEGRATDYITVKNEKVWLFDFENTLLTDDAVQLCEAVGLTIEEGIKQIPVAHVVLCAGLTEPPESIIRRLHALCAKTFKAEALPCGYKIRSCFDVLPSGKRDTTVLKSEYAGFVAGDGVTRIDFM